MARPDPSVEVSAVASPGDVPLGAAVPGPAEAATAPADPARPATSSSAAAAAEQRPRRVGVLLLIGVLAVALAAAGLALWRPWGAGPGGGTSVQRSALLPGVLPDQVPPALPGLDPAAPIPTTPGLTRALAPVLSSADLGPKVRATIVDVLSGKALLDRGGSVAVPPASSGKVLTAAAALAELGPATTFRTSVVAAPGQVPSAAPGGSASPGVSPSASPRGTAAPAATGPVALTLVGGGDPALERGPTTRFPYPAVGTLAALADGTARALGASARRGVVLTYDASRFTGPTTNPAWPPSYVAEGQVAPASALMVDLGKADPADVSLSPERVPDPAADAAAAFAAALRGKGVTVTAVRPGRAPVTADEVAGVDSPPVSALVARMLDVSSNDIAETLARQIAVHQGEPGTAAAGVAAVRASITRLGLPGADDRMVDAAGLARQNLVTTRLLAGTVATAAHGGTAGADASAKPSAGRRGTPDPDAADVDLSALVPGLPVAAFTGTLALRFTGPAAAGAGVVRGKTGTLSGITSMVGTVTTREGRLLAFSFVADAVPVGFAETNAARAALDRGAAVLAGCGCR